MTLSRKTEDQELIGLNAVGLSFSYIANRFQCHPTTISHRLKSLDIKPADTRRAFMEDIYESLTPLQKDWLIEQLHAGQSIKQFLKSLIVKEYTAKKYRREP